MKQSAEALRLSQIIHAHWDHEPESCVMCLDTAKTIDTELQLHERNAALLLAQQVCDIEEIDPHMAMICDTASAISELREALTTICKRASSVHAEVQKTPSSQPPQAGDDTPGSPS